MTLGRTAPTTAERRRLRMILGGLLHQPGLLPGARGLGLSGELIGDLALRGVFRLIERGPLPVRAAIRGSDVTPAAATARALHAEMGPLDPALIMALIEDLVEAVEFPAEDEVTDHDAPDERPQGGSCELADPVGAHRGNEAASPAESSRNPSGSRPRGQPQPQPQKTRHGAIPPGLDSAAIIDRKLRWLDEMNTDPSVSNMEFRALYRMAGKYLDGESGTISVGLERLAADIGGTRHGVQKVLRKAVASNRLLHVGGTMRGGRGRTNTFIPMFREPQEPLTQLSVNPGSRIRARKRGF
jgi:hypothetical protein